jgi:hypothetical protein
MRKTFIILISLLYAIQAYGQDNTIKPQAWKLMSYGGSIGLNGQYNQSFSGLDTNSNNYTFGGSVFLTTQSYVWHPNFLTLIVSGGYSPQQGEFSSSQIPDYFSNLSSIQYNIYAQFFKNLDYKLNIYALHNEQKGEDRFYDRDITTNKWGADFTYNKAYNIKAKLEHQNNDEFNNLTNTAILWNKTALQANVKKTFFKSDRNELNVNIQKNTSEQKDLYNNSTNLASLNFINSVFLNKKETIPLRSSLSYSKTNGNVNYRSMGFNQVIGIPLAKKLSFNSQFGKNSYKRTDNITKETKFNNNLSYNLYSSLNTSLSYSYGKTQRAESFLIENKTISASSTYNKKIPAIKGNFSMSYIYTTQNYSNAIEDNILNVYNEAKSLEDGIIVLLDNPNIIQETIEVKDVTGTIIYQENVDYILIQLGNYIQIQRLIGGEILNNIVVYIDYDVLQNSSFAFNSEEGEFRMSIDCFDRFLTLTYNNSYKNFNLNEVEMVSFGLDKYRRIKYDARFKYKVYYAGVSYQDNESNAFPTKLLSYNLNASGKLSKKINFQVSAVRTNYLLYFIEGRTHKTTLISSDLMYNLSYKSRLNFNLSFSKQKGDIQNYSLISGRSEFKTRFNQLELSMRLNYQYRSVPNQNFSSQYIGTSINITRKF